MSENEAALDDLDLDGAIAMCAEDPSREARVSWAELRSVRAMRSCLRGDVEAGFAEWAEVIEAEPKVAGSYLLRSRWLGSTDLVAALADCERAVAAEPTNAITYARRGDFHRQLGVDERAIADYRRAVGLEPELFDAHYTMGTMFSRLGRFEEARAAYSRAIKLAPRYVEFYLGRAAALEHLGDFAGALRDFDRILELDPTQLEARSHRAYCLTKTGGVRAAVAEMDGLADDLAKGPGAHETFTLLGGIHAALGDRDKALSAFNRALALDPDDVPALAQRAKIHGEKGNHAAALADLDRAIKLAPEDAALHVARAKPLALLRRLDDAVASASRGIELAPDNILAHRLRAVYRSHAEEDATDLVKADFKRAWELSPRTAVYRKELVDYLMDLGDVDEAVTVYDKALSLEPDSVELLYQRAACRVKREEVFYERDIEDHETEEVKLARLRAAVADLERAFELGKRDENVYFELIRAHEGLGDPEATMREVNRALAVFPDLIPVLALRRRLRKGSGDVEGAAADLARLKELKVHVQE